MGESVKNEEEYMQENLRKKLKDDKLKVIKSNNVFKIILSTGKQYTFDPKK